MLYCCQKLNLSASQAFNINRFYGDETRIKIEEDPYRLLTFNVSFTKCDEIAKKLGIGLNDPRRLLASVEESLYEVLDSGSVVASEDKLSVLIHERVPDPALVSLALSEKNDSANNFVRLSGGLLQSNGAYVMEQYVATRLSELISQPSQVLLQPHQINGVIKEYENTNCFSLTQNQTKAVREIINHHFYLINGGAGVGKTTVLDAVYHVFDAAGIMPVQLALAAKAAKRMSEATGRESYTIERFIRNYTFQGIDCSRLAVVIDESSMVDLHSMYRLLSFIPEDVRVIMVGDVGQLPPIGFGLVLHEITKVESVPSVMLDVVKRQSITSNIPSVARQIREGVSPDLHYSDVFVIPGGSKKDIEKKAVELYTDSPDDVQIISPTNALVRGINKQCSELNTGKKLYSFNEQFDAYEDTGFRLEDKVICTANLYALELLNGTLGTIKLVYSEPLVVRVNPRDHRSLAYSYGQVIWEGGHISELTDEVLDNLAHSYAMTIHKSQGSQFKIVVIPLHIAKNMDRSMLYTAVTRASKKVVFVGEAAIINQAIGRVAYEERKANLKNKLEHVLVVPT